MPEASSGKRKLARTPAPEMIQDSLRSEILRGSLEAGQQLTQEDLARRFETSRIPVREALKKLESEGLVTYYPNRGAVVSAPTLAEIVEMFDIRVALECRALRIAIPHISDIEIDQAREVLRQYDAEQDPERWGAMNWEFHSMLYRPCDRPKLLSLINANYGNVGRFTRTRVSRAAGRDRPQEQHYQLLELVTEQRADEAAKLLEDHILYSLKMIQAAMRNA